MPRGIPKYIRVYDNGGETIDRYTVVFTGKYHHKPSGEFAHLTMDDSPFCPRGFGMFDTSNQQIDTNGRGFAPAIGRKCHLGLRIPFKQLPKDCQRLALSDYRDLWDIK